MADKLTYEYVKQYFAEQGCALLEIDYLNAHAKMRYICLCGNVHETRWSDFVKGVRCKACGMERVAKKLRTDFALVKSYFSENGCVLLSETYINKDTSMEYICVCGNRAKICWASFRRGSRCRKCYSERTTGQQNGMWNPDREAVAKAEQMRIRSYTLLHNTLRLTKIKKCDKTQQLLGYTPQDLMRHLESQSNWPQIKDDEWHIDHIFPIKAFVEHGITDPKIINALDNLQPLDAKENLTKSDTYNKQDFLAYLATKGITLSSLSPSPF